MLKLSRRNWNNVLIFVVLLLMFSLYDWSGKSQDAAAVNLLSPDATLLSISVGPYRLIEVNGNWQLQPQVHPQVSAQQMFHAWNYTQVSAVKLSQPPQQAPIAQASVQLTGEFVPQIWLLYPDPPHFMLQQAGDTRFFLLTEQQARLLFLLE